MKRLIIWLLAIILIIAVLVIRIRMRYASAKSSSDYTVSVYFHEVSESDITVTKKYTGPVMSFDQIEVSPQVNQKIRKILKQEGDKVEADETIALLEERELKLKLDQSGQRKNAMDSQIESLLRRQEFLVSNLKFLEKELERNSRLLEKGAISQQNYDTARNSYIKAKTDLESFSSDLEKARYESDSLKSQIEETRILLGYAKIKSPADGIIRKVLMKEGELASPGRPIFIIDSTELYRIVFDLPREDAGIIKPGQKAILNADPPVETSVSSIYPSLRENIFTGEILLEYLPPDFPVGSSITLDVITEKKESVPAVLNNAVFISEGKYFAYIINDNTLKMVAITPGIKGRDKTEVLSGLETGDKVALGSFMTVKKYRDGQPVHIAGEL